VTRLTDLLRPGQRWPSRGPNCNATLGDWPTLPQRRWRLSRRPGSSCAEEPSRPRPDYRVIRQRSRGGLCSHISINFDRTGFQEDCNVVFPLDRLNELAAQGRSARWPRRTTRSWAPPILCRWNSTRVSWPSG
jgi:hypothetical protein